MLRLAAASQQRRYAPQQTGKGFHARDLLAVVSGKVR